MPSMPQVRSAPPELVTLRDLTDASDALTVPACWGEYLPCGALFERQTTWPKES